MLAYGEWLENKLLAPVPHRQYVFALPKLVRPFFRYRRQYLGQLCRLIAGLLKTGFRAMVPHGQHSNHLDCFRKKHPFGWLAEDDPS